jgi:hypothetical protein
MCGVNYPSRERKGNLTANVDRGLYSYVTLRAKLATQSAGVRVSPSTMVGKIVEWWTEQGAPSTFQADLNPRELPYDPSVNWAERLKVFLTEKPPLKKRSSSPFPKRR